MMNQSNTQTPGAPVAPFPLITRDELKRLSWDLGMSDADIARMYQVSTNTVYGRRRQMNLLQGAMTSQELSDAVRLAERVKRLPREAIDEIRAIVERYQSI